MNTLDPCRCNVALVTLSAVLVLGCARGPTLLPPRSDAFGQTAAGRERIALGAYDGVLADAPAEIVRMRAILRWENAHLTSATRARFGDDSLQRPRSALMRLLALHDRDVRLARSVRDTSAVRAALERLSTSVPDLALGAIRGRRVGILSILFALDPQFDAREAPGLVAMLTADPAWCDADANEGCARLYAALDPSHRAILELATAATFDPPPWSAADYAALPSESSAFVIRELARAAIVRDRAAVDELVAWLRARDPIDLGGIVLELLTRDVTTGRVDAQVLFAVASHDAVWAAAATENASGGRAALASLALARAYVALHVGLDADAAAFVRPFLTSSDPLVRAASELVDGLVASDESRDRTLAALLATAEGCRSPYVTSLARRRDVWSGENPFSLRAAACVARHRILVGPRFAAWNWEIDEEPSDLRPPADLVFVDDSASNATVDASVLAWSDAPAESIEAVSARTSLPTLVALRRARACAQTPGPIGLCETPAMLLANEQVLTFDDLERLGAEDALAWLAGRVDIPVDLRSFERAPPELHADVARYLASFEATAIALDPEYVDARLRVLSASGHANEAHRAFADSGAVLDAASRALHRFWLRDVDAGLAVDVALVQRPLEFLDSLDVLDGPPPSTLRAVRLEAPPRGTVARYARAREAFRSYRYATAGPELESLATLLEGSERAELLGLAGICALASQNRERWAAVARALAAMPEGAWIGTALAAFDPESRPSAARAAVEATWRLVPGAPLVARYSDVVEELRVAEERDPRDDAVVLHVNAPGDRARCECQPATVGTARCIAESRCVRESRMRPDDAGLVPSANGFAARVAEVVAMGETEPVTFAHEVALRASSVADEVSVPTGRPPASSDLASEAITAYQSLLDAYASGESIEEFFLPELACYRGRAHVPVTEVAHERDEHGGSLESTALVVVSTTDDSVVLADYGLGGGGGYPAPYQHVVVMRRTASGFRVESEVAARGPFCGRSPAADLRPPADYAHCSRRHAACVRPCQARERAQGPSNGSEVCTLDCSHALACCLHAPSADPTTCE